MHPLRKQTNTQNKWGQGGPRLEGPFWRRRTSRDGKGTLWLCDLTVLVFLAVLFVTLWFDGVSSQGSRGHKGSRGDQGVRGRRGPAGEKGERGGDAAPGDEGDPGRWGDAGRRGEQGPGGEPGGRGTPGLKGSGGPAGRPGHPGPAGLSGLTGEPGLPGQAFVQPGLQGHAGRRGPSAQCNCPLVRAPKRVHTIFIADGERPMRRLRVENVMVLRTDRGALYIYTDSQWISVLEGPGQ
ncbi:acetylcholinesterase collagenic tail peptide-like isoform X3 [Pungitius pungitius]|uniref:acetylcholinesterase collagenic tail peptide-like isoform X3 n=1 Tax=Pungitius pungitius TaxID=134920 RepID=UPI002E1170D4